MFFISISHLHVRYKEWNEKMSASVTNSSAAATSIVDGNVRSTTQVPKIRSGVVGVNTSASSSISSGTTSTSIAMTSAVPMLKVMRIQAPELSCFALGNNQSSSSRNGGGGIVNRQYYNRDYLSDSKSSWMLPDSFGVIYIGETF